jgi:transcriptional regulator with XRE-family HTH domain
MSVMQKEKLRVIRKQKGYTQQQVADFIATDVSNYSRKESGDVKIVKDEWDKLARFLMFRLKIFTRKKKQQSLLIMIILYLMTDHLLLESSRTK